MSDLISRQAAMDKLSDAYHGVDALEEHFWARQSGIGEAYKIIRELPSEEPEFYDYSDIELLWRSFAEENDIDLTPTAKQLKDALWCGYEKGKNDAKQQPSQVARDIATIFENEQDMRVILKNAEDTVCHCNVKENAELIAKILDCDTDGKAYRLPSAQPNIIRCKECKHWRGENSTYIYCQKLFNMGVLDVYDYMTEEDDFCSWAERA